MAVMSLEPIVPTDTQVETLYQLLQRRRHTISHTTTPDYAAHAAFVAAHPYRAWFLVRDAERYIGSVYLGQDNTIGINLDDEQMATHLPQILAMLNADFSPLPAIKSVRAAHFMVNVSPTNHALREALERQGYPLLQLTYRI